jgi:hypothetical protein
MNKNPLRQQFFTVFASEIVEGDAVLAFRLTLKTVRCIDSRIGGKCNGV